MAIKLVVAVRDSALGLFAQPWFVVSRGQAIRAFADEVNRKGSDTDLAKHPEDFELHAVGEFDEGSGVFIQGERELLIRGKDAVVKEQ